MLRQLPEWWASCYFGQPGVDGVQSLAQRLPEGDQLRHWPECVAMWQEPQVVRKAERARANPVLQLHPLPRKASCTTPNQVQEVERIRAHIPGHLPPSEMGGLLWRLADSRVWHPQVAPMDLAYTSLHHPSTKGAA